MMHEDYQKSGIHISDVDFLIEDDRYLYLVEYKNACVPGAANPEAFNPEGNRMIDKVSRKFYDSLHYLHLFDRSKPVDYIYVLEYPKGDYVTRKRLRNRLKKELPFELQKQVGKGRRLIHKVDVVSIREWNENEFYGRYPICPVDLIPGLPA